MSSNKLKINLFGEAWKLKQLMLPEALLQTFEEVAMRMKQPLNEVIVDPFFYYDLKNNAIQSIEDLEGNCIDVLRGQSALQCNVDLGAATMVAIKMAVESYRQRKTMVWDAQTETVKAT